MSEIATDQQTYRLLISIAKHPDLRAVECARWLASPDVYETNGTMNGRKVKVRSLYHPGASLTICFTEGVACKMSLRITASLAPKMDAACRTVNQRRRSGAGQTGKPFVW
jgi:hypothetical protein